MLGVVKRLIYIGWKRWNQYKIEYLYAFIFTLSELFFILVWYGVAKFASANGYALAGWTFPQLATVVILFNIILASAEASGYYDAMATIHGKSRAQLSSLLTKPIHPFLYLSLKHFYFPGVARVLFYMALLFYIYHIYYIVPSLTFFALVLIGVGIGAALYYIPILFLIAFERNADLPSMFIQSLFYNSNFPYTSLKGFAFILFHFILPIGFIASVPAYCLEKNCLNFVMAGAGVLAVLLAVVKLLSVYAWKRFEAVGG
ncbi:MAG: ABC transporter permease [Caldisphaeraceae archaeon]|nr:ABC transporter permease [Caldisphaeraceae archaeon]